MKATVWLWPAITTLLCAAQLVCTAQRQRQYLDYPATNAISDDYFIEKRGRPSLSIVNPLDVLRQRLLLEIARRQMRENTRQVEVNRAILKSIGKRSSSRDFLDFLKKVPKSEDDDRNNKNNGVEKTNDTDPMGYSDASDDNQIRYLYSLHKNRYINK